MDNSGDVRPNNRILTALVALVVAVGLAPTTSAAISTAKNSFGAQCFFDSPSRSARVWWTETRTQSALTGGGAGGAATDGTCATVPLSVPWVAQQLDDIIRAYRAAGLPVAPSDKGIQRFAPGASDDGSAALDVYLDGTGNDVRAAELGCTTFWRLRGRVKTFRTVGKMHVFNSSSLVPEGRDAQDFRQMLAHELVHSAQCAVTDTRRLIAGISVQGPWVEAIPTAFSQSLVGGDWSMGSCDQSTRLVSTHEGDVEGGYDQWPFWYSLLAPPSGSSYVALLRDVITVPVAKAGPQLVSAIHRHFTDVQLSRALLAWVTKSYFGGTLTSASGVPITWDINSLTGNDTFIVDDPALLGELAPPAGGTAQRAVTLAPMTCAALLVPWPDGAQTVSVGATGAPGGVVSDVMAAGLDVSPGSAPTGPCGVDGPRTVLPLTGNQFVAARPCTSENGVPKMWVLMVNGGSKPLTLNVSATAS